MKSAIVLVASVALLAGARTGDSPADGLTVHEWGTFTSIAGEAGRPVYWNGLGCTTELPPFVKDQGLRNIKSAYNTTVRMETPVIYFYSAHAMTANVAVRFPKGVVSESYPRGSYRNYSEGNELSSRIEWNNIKVQPGSDAVLPSDGSSNAYYAARGTDAAPLEVNGEHEKFLFYRGIGNFAVPPISRAILFDNHGGHMRYRMADSEAAYRETSPAELRTLLEARLTEQGLYPKEARAMLDTWHDSWFEEGTRLIYIVPSKAVDEILPLTIEPAPQKTVRVFVGRQEQISEATKQTVQAAIARSDWGAVAPYRRFLAQILAGNNSEVLNRFACKL